MNDTDIWLTIASMTLVTFLMRTSLFVFGHAVKLPPKLQHALRYAPAAALAAIVAPDLLLAAPDGQLGNVLSTHLHANLHWLTPKLLAGIGATLFFLRTRHMLGTLAVGMLLFTALR